MSVRRQARCRLGSHPELKLGSGYEIGGFREARCVVEVVEHAPEMVRVGMCNNGFGDGCVVDAGGVHVFGKLARTWHVMRPGADIDEDGF